MFLSAVEAPLMRCCDDDSLSLVPLVGEADFVCLLLSLFITAVGDVDVDISGSTNRFVWSFLLVEEEDKGDNGAAVVIDASDCETSFNSKLPSRCSVKD